MIKYIIKGLFLAIALSSLASCTIYRPLTAAQKARIEAEVDAMWAANHAQDAILTQAQKEEERIERNLLNELKSWIGTPYRYGGNSRSGVDCSGLVCQVYQNVYGMTLSRRSEDQYRYDIKNYLAGNQLNTGDLVFFSIDNKAGNVNHVGIYLDEYMFVHAGSKGVVIDDLRKAYWIKYWIAGGKVK